MNHRFTARRDWFACQQVGDGVFHIEEPFYHAAYAAWFEAGKFPARTCIGVTALAGGADVEIDLVAVKIGGGAA